jgi:hypothetical protein
MILNQSQIAVPPKPVHRSHYSRPDAKAVEAAQNHITGILEVFGDVVVFQGALPKDLRGVVAWCILIHMYQGVSVHGVRVTDDIAPVVASKGISAALSYAKQYVDIWVQDESNFVVMPFSSHPQRVEFVSAGEKHTIVGEMTMTVDQSDQRLKLERIAWRLWQCQKILGVVDLRAWLLELLEPLQPMLEGLGREADDLAPWEEPGATTQPPLLPLPARKAGSDWRR